MTKGKKPYFVGEFGFVDTPHIRRVYDTTIQDGIAGALLWSLRFHSRDGGFYWHMEVGTGGNFYKAYHWPGFASGAAYDETAGPGTDARKGLRDSGRRAAAIEPPAPPRALADRKPGRDLLARLDGRRVVRRRASRRRGRPLDDGWQECLRRQRAISTAV